MIKTEILLLPIDNPSAWPAELLAFLSARYDMFLDWSVGPSRFSAREYDAAIYELAELLQPYSLIGWHCTRLTDEEIEAIKSGGMQLPCPEMLAARIDAVRLAGLIELEAAEALQSINQSAESNRRGMIWWCFFPPRSAGQGGIGALLGTWGGEALYNSHDDDEVIGPLLRSIGTPCLVEGAIPISSLGKGHRPAFSFVANYLRSKGHDVSGWLEFEDNIKADLPPSRIRRVLRFPEVDFLALTGCMGWHMPLGSGPR